MRILVTHTVALNGGDAAILLGLIRLLKMEFGSDTQIQVIGSSASALRQYYPDLYTLPSAYQFTRRPRIPFLGEIIARLDQRRLLMSVQSMGKKWEKFGIWATSPNEREILRAFGGADLIVATGGTYLVPNYDLRGKFFDFQMARSSPAPYCMFTQSLGPFRDAGSRRNMKKIVDNTLLVFLRDERSREHLREAGAHSPKVTVAPDAAFALLDPDETSFATSAPVGEKLKIAVSVREWRHFLTKNPQEGMNDYLNAIKKTVIHLVDEHDAEVDFLSTCQGIPEYWTDDSRTALRVLESLPDHVKRHVHVDRSYHHPLEMLEILKGYDFSITTRMHAAILSLLAGTPPVAIAYEFKTQELFSRLGVNDLVINIEDIVPENLIKSSESLLDNLSVVRRKLSTSVRNEVEGAYRSGKLLHETYRKWTQRQSVEKR